jgi:nicotinamide-nucleotide amidase
MKAFILSIGDELINGETVDTNSAHLSRRLRELGIVTAGHATVGDDRAAVAGAIADAASRAELVLVTGGLGPTADDVTREGLADAMGGVPLRLDESSLRRIEEFFRQRGRQMHETNRVQAMMPEGAEAMENVCGTAPGLAAAVGRSRVFVMPGVPQEMREMFERHVAPRLPAAEGTIVQRVLHCFGVGESDIGASIADLMRRGANPAVGTTVSAGVISVRIVAGGGTPAAAAAMAGATAEEVRRRLGSLVYGQDGETLAAATGRLLRRRGGKLATAESCTGGMIGELVTGVAGSSDYYAGGVVSYANEVKRGVLGVAENLLRQHGAVSEPVAAAMADGCRRRLGTDWALAVTGIAGPGGGSAEKPVGLVYIALAGPKGTEVARHVFAGDRATIRLRSSLSALNMLRLALEKGTGSR